MISATEINDILDNCHELLLEGNVFQGMDFLFTELQRIYQLLEPQAWQILWQSTMNSHRLTDIIYQDPFTMHSFSKPRGYAGDAELIDYIYKLRTAPDATELGQKIFEFNTNTDASLSVRSRRSILAQTIDRIAKAPYPVEVLSLACGHFREASLSEAVREKAIGRLIAFDQDRSSLGLVQSELSEYGVEIECGNVGGIIRNKHSYNNLDLVYAAGLYDYLSQPMAVRLTKVMFEMLRSGGTLLVANFIVHNSIGYMESFMQWHLIYRSIAEIEDFTQEIESSKIADKRTFFDKHQNIVFLEVTKS